MHVASLKHWSLLGEQFCFLKRYSRHIFPERWGKLLSDVGSGTIVKLRVKERSQLGHNRHKPMECQLHALAQTDREIFQEDR